ncbi:dystrotelin [Diretmus argenteus]
MDLDSIEGLNEVRPSVYRAAMKLLSLQKLCYMGGASNQDIDRGEVTQTLNRMFHAVSQEVPGHVTLEAPEQTCSLIYKLYDRDQTGCVSVRSLEVALIALSADTLSAKHRALVCVAERTSRERGSVSRSELRSLLQDLSQVPAAVQEEGVFGSVNAAVRSCFNGVLTPSVREEHVLSWLQSEPRLLLWLPTLYRLSVSQNVNHAVRCHTCKTFPITGLRYRCMKCVNLHLCQSCFLTDKQTKKHKTHHPVLEHCTQPTWRESLASFLYSARHALLPRRYARREAERRRGLMWAEPQDTQDRTLPSDSTTRLAASSARHSPSSSACPKPDEGPSHDDSGRLPPLRSSSSRRQSKALQTEEETPTQQCCVAGQKKTSALLKEVRNLQRDKWLLDHELQGWRVAVQSEQGILEDRCSEMEVTMETMRQHNLRLQDMLTKALSRAEAHQLAHNTQGESDSTPPSEPGEEEVEEEEYRDVRNVEKEELEHKEREEVESEEGGETGSDIGTQSPTSQRGTPPSHHLQSDCCGEEPAVDRHLNRPMGEQLGLKIDKHPSHPMGQQDANEEVGLKANGQFEEDYGTCSPVDLEEQLLEVVERLRAALFLQTDRHRGRETGELSYCVSCYSRAVVLLLLILLQSDQSIIGSALI